MKPLTVRLLMAVHVLLAAVTYLLSKQAAVGFPDPESLTLARGLGASVLLLPVAFAWRRHARFSAREWGRLALLAVLLVPLNQYLFLRGVRHTTPGHPALLYALTPACVLLITSAGQRRLPRPQRLAGVLLALAGVLLLLRPWQRTDLVTAWRTGDLWILAAVLAWALYTVLARELCRAHSSVLVTSLSILLGTALFLPLGASRLLAADLARVPLSAWAGLLWLAAVTSVLMMFLWNRLLKTLDAVQLTICMNAQPLATAGLSAALAALGVLAEKQDLGAVFWTGTLLVLVGVWLVQTAAPPARRIAPAPMELPG